MKRYCLIISILYFSHSSLFAQKNNSHKPKFFISAGYGLAGSFFVRSYEEPPADFTGYKEFTKKNFIGAVQNIAIGLHLKKNIEIKGGLNFQHFTRKIKARDTLSGVIIDLDHTIHHRDYMWFGNFNKNYNKKNHVFSWGLGLYYLRPQQEEVTISPPRFFQNRERNQKNSRLNEGGSFLELAYEYKFQPKVNIGVKTQFYYTLSAGYPESITLFPYIKINF